MISIDARESINIWMRPKLNGTELGFGTYTANEAINGSKDNTKAWAHVVDVSASCVIATSVGGAITTVAAHGLPTGTWVAVDAHDGNTALNGNIYQITSTGEKTLTLTGVGGSTAGTGGTLFPIVTSTDGAVLKEVYLYRDAIDTKRATLNIRKGAIANLEKTYGVACWFDSTGGGSGGYRIYDFQVFQFRQRASVGTVPYT